MGDEIPFFISAPGETDVLFAVVAVAVTVIVVALGTISLTIRAWPERLAAGAAKWQLQLVAILGLLSLMTFNNLIWLAALALAVVRFPDLVTPLKELTRTLKQSGAEGGRGTDASSSRREAHE